MATQPIPVPEAQNLVQVLLAMSDSLDDYRLNTPDLTAEQRLPFAESANKLNDAAHFFEAQQIDAMIAGIQDDLAKIKSATTDATAQLKVLTDISKAISIATAGVALGTAILAGNPGAIIGAAQALATAASA